VVTNGSKGRCFNLEFNPIASGSKGNCYILSSGKNKLLIEAGLNFKEIQKQLNFDLKELDGVLISHEHL